MASAATLLYIGSWQNGENQYYMYILHLMSPNHCSPTTTDLLHRQMYALDNSHSAGENDKIMPCMTVSRHETLLSQDDGRDSRTTAQTKDYMRCEFIPPTSRDRCTSQAYYTGITLDPSSPPRKWSG